MLCQTDKKGRALLVETKNVDILFIIPPYHKRNGSGSLFPLGIGAIMAFLDVNGLNYDYINCPQLIDTLFPADLEKLDDILRKLLRRYNPTLVGIGPCVTPGIKGLEVVAKCCIDTFGSEKIFAGGPFTLLPSQEWFFYEHLGLSYIIKGDGEEAVYEAIIAMKNGSSLKQCNAVSHPGYSKINTVSNLEKMPFPKRVGMVEDEFSERRKSTNASAKTAHIVASRGCPYHCAYCVSGNLQIPFRKRSSNNIAAEMQMLADKYGVSDIVFYDDCFFTSAKTVHQELDDFCAALDLFQLDMTWQIEIRPDILVELTDIELLKASRYGCRQMNIGVEKTYQDGAFVFGKPYDYLKLKDYLGHAHEVAPIRMTGTFILGGEGETITSVRETIRASTEMNLDEAEFSPLFVYPGTPIYDSVFSNPRSWVDVIMASEEPWGEVVYESKALDKATLISLVNEAYKYFNNGRKETKRIQDRYHLKGN